MIELIPELTILHCLFDELNACGIPSMITSTGSSHQLRFGDDFKFYVMINETDLVVATDLMYELGCPKPIMVNILFLTDLTVPDSVEKFMVVAQQLVDGKNHRE